MLATIELLSIKGFKLFPIDKRSHFPCFKFINKKKINFETKKVNVPNIYYNYLFQKCTKIW